MLRQMSAAFCGVLIIFACSLPAKAAAKPARLATRTKVQADVTKLPPFIGAASTYNPFRPGPGEGGKLTASGEDYSANSWTAAIQTNLRRFFSGVFSGKAYRPRFALVETADKRAVVKINDVGPLKPGRIIDLNEQTMQYFDPTMERGVIKSVKVTPLHGDDWIAGPV
jgi:rare lipoprotein A